MRTANLIPCLTPYWKKYTAEASQAQMKPLEVVFELASAIAAYNNVMFDSLLARLVVDEATKGNLLDDEQAPYLLPVPLRLEWRSEEGLPLWAANDIRPISANHHTLIWWHKRTLEPQLVADKPGVKKSSISGIQGRFKEKRGSIPAQVATFWRTTCVGDEAEISRLLSKCDKLGKRGHGLVKRCFIRGINKFNFERPIPVQSLPDGASLMPSFGASWTAPYWVGVPETRGECVLPRP